MSLTAEQLLFQRSYFWFPRWLFKRSVERGKIALAEFLCDGKVASNFSKWLIDGAWSKRAAGWLKECTLPPLYWGVILKGREWLARSGHTA